jgi:maltose phosphorylase
MKDYLVKHPWKIIEDSFHKEYNQITESLCSLGNGMIGQRGNFEEHYSGETLQGNYVAGIYYPDKTRVGWWKNGYPEYFAKVLNSADWTDLDIYFGNVRLDINKSTILDFYRELDMKTGILSRRISFQIENIKATIKSERFCHYATKETAWLKYEVFVNDYSGPITIQSSINFDVRNQDSNYDENFWDYHCHHIDNDWGHVFCKTKKTEFKVCAGIKNKFAINGEKISDRSLLKEERKVGHQIQVDVKPGDSIQFIKHAAIISEYHHGNVRLIDTCKQVLQDSASIGYEEAKKSHIIAWQSKWEQGDIEIEGDVAAQQGIRFNIFHLNQTYTGEDSRLNIGPKGFTGEKYGGSTYWDTEAYCLPFYLGTAKPDVGRNLLIYRHNHLQKAIDNAATLGFKDGAALYPMVTINGEECHNEWEITFEEIHRNGAIAYAIYDYVNYTGDKAYLKDYGFEVLVAIARFWSQRVNWSTEKEQYVILGVTGPNEYENNVNNNWYTNYIAKWCLQYTIEVYQQLKSSHNATVNLNAEELERWNQIIQHMYFPFDDKRDIYLQQDGFLDKEVVTVDELPKEEQPINQHWSWDRVLRSCYIKQADVLQGFYFFENDFTKDELRRHFEFYEPLTVHESSLSPCVHAILASSLGKDDKAYEMYLRTSRLDLDDYNNDTEDGLHITSMAGTWMTITKGFGGMRVRNSELSFNPTCPNKWQSYSFKIVFENQLLAIKVNATSFEIKHHGDKDIEVEVSNTKKKLTAKGTQSWNII